VAAISFTSGTTGQPKGCVITHANVCSQVEAAFGVIPLDASCRLASILPLSHLFELTCGLLYPLAAGAAIHYIPTRRGPDIVRVLSERRITHMMVVPQLLVMMGQQIDSQLQATLPSFVYRAVMTVAERVPLSWRRRLFWMVHRRLGGHLRMLASGGAALLAETQRLWERLGVRVVQGYGTSECSPMIACARPDGKTPVGSVGPPIPGVSVRLSPEGELLVRGPNVMRGYWQDPERTSEVLRAGWYSTGDLASIDTEGNIYLAGRARDLIVLPSGMKVWPQDVEDMLRAEPGIKDAAVVASQAGSGGAVLHAYLLPAPGTSRSRDLVALVAHCNGHLAQHQRLASASWWTGADFPRTSMLKVRRHLLPQPDRGAAVEVATALAADDPVGQAIAGVAHSSDVQATRTLGELGLDSLGLVELAVALEEKIERPVQDDDLRLEMTVDQVRALVSGGRLVSAEALELDEAGAATRRTGHTRGGAPCGGSVCRSTSCTGWQSRARWF
jgi:long-chain acyl-CoA synthetase